MSYGVQGQSYFASRSSPLAALRVRSAARLGLRRSNHNPSELQRIGRVRKLSRALPFVAWRQTTLSADLGTGVAIPTKADDVLDPDFNRVADCERIVSEQLINRFDQWRRIATHCEMRVNS